MGSLELFHGVLFIGLGILLPLALIIVVILWAIHKFGCKENDMKIAKVILICIYGAGLLISAHEHGKYKTRKHNFWETLIATAVEVGLLWWGGFFG